MVIASEQEGFFLFGHFIDPEGEISRGVNYLYASNGYPESLELSITKGRFFSDQYPTDTSAALINEAMLRNLGWKDPLGKKLRFNDGGPETTEPTYHIVGVIKDFHQKSLHNEIKPMAIFNSKNNDFIIFKLQVMR